MALELRTAYGNARQETLYTPFSRKLFQSEKVANAAVAFRQLCRLQKYTSPSAGCAPGYVQANLIILPKAYAFDFLLFCLRNPRSCPLLDVTTPGSVNPSMIASEADLRTDLPKYQIWNYGEIVAESYDVSSYWKDDLVSFLLGCSFSWEFELSKVGLTPRHVTEKRNVAMYETNVPLNSVGPFSGNLVVSMRPYRRENILEVQRITTMFPSSHGCALHIGKPSEIGINFSDCKDILKNDFSNITPDFGDSIMLKEDELPLFWACGVSAIAAIKNAKIPFVITHAPGHMFVSDVLIETLKETPN